MIWLLATRTNTRVMFMYAEQKLSYKQG